MRLTLDQAKEKYIEAKKAYYSGSPIMSDPTFDRLEAWIKKKDPKWSHLQKTGVKVGKKVEVKLPHFMPSLSKCYEDIDSWFTKHPRYRWSYMAKLDGCSVLLQYKNGKPARLITRGDGEHGKDISYFIPYLSIPKKIPTAKDLSFRCEAILTKDAYTNKWRDLFDNPRNMVSGILNRQDVHEGLRDIHLVVLGVFGRPQYKGLQEAFKYGFETVYCKLDSPRSQVKHFECIRGGKYEADGVVICNPDWVYEYESAEKPKHDIIAYKENVEFADTKVLNIIYQTSVNGRLIPKIEVEPVVLAGASITYCTAHNAKWMVDHGIGVNAIVRITRSGDVIPKIIDVVQTGDIVYPAVPYKMDGVHFVTSEVSDEQRIKEISKFIRCLGVETVKEKTVTTLYNDLKITSIKRLLIALHHENFLPRLKTLFGSKKGKLIYDALHPIVCTSYPVAHMMVASNCFDAGVSYKRLTALQEQDFDLLVLSNWSEQDIKTSIISPGIGEATAELIASGLVNFNSFWKNNSKLLKPLLPYVKRKLSIVKGPLNGVNVTFTGYRSSEQEALIKSLGGDIISFSSKTTVLLYIEGGRKSTKVEKAGNKAMTFSEFKTKYGF